MFKYIRRFWCKHQVNKLLKRRKINGYEYLALECVECDTLHYKSYAGGNDE